MSNAYTVTSISYFPQSSGNPCVTLVGTVNSVNVTTQVYLSEAEAALGQSTAALQAFVANAMLNAYNAITPTTIAVPASLTSFTV